MYSYIKQQNESSFDNDIVYKRVCPGDWTKVSWPLSRIQNDIL